MSNILPPLGFHHALQLDGSGGAQSLDWQDIAGHTHTRDRLWVHCNYEDNAIQKWLMEKTQLDSLATQALIDEDTRPRIAFFEKGLLITLRGVNNNIGAEPEDMVSIRIWLEPGRMISVARKKLTSVDDIIEQLQTKRGAKSTSGLMVALCDRLEWHVSQLIDDYDDEIENIESRDLEENPKMLRATLSELRRRVVMPRRYLSPQRDAFSLLATEAPDWFEARAVMRLQEVRNRLQRHLEDIDAVRDRTIIVQDELQALLSDQLSSRMYVLNIVAAIFLPLSFLTGLFGINLGGIPGANYDYAFSLFSGITLIIALGVLTLFYWKRWF